jgi:hypothetical protein
LGREEDVEGCLELWRAMLHTCLFACLSSFRIDQNESALGIFYRGRPAAIDSGEWELELVETCSKVEMTDESPDPYKWPETFPHDIDERYSLTNFKLTDAEGNLVPLLILDGAGIGPFKLTGTRCHHSRTLDDYGGETTVDVDAYVLDLGRAPTDTKTSTDQPDTRGLWLNLGEDAETHYKLTGSTSSDLAIRPRQPM